ncbi:MAG: hypothetical protein K0R50_3274 [Eubacterium sp.]|jgi:GNAT superfamily N-acetyltransferase|nr:hypothetical protein [Eubacterium sp.]
MNYTVRTLELNELVDIYNRITQDFAEGEYPPFDKLYYQLENKIQKGWVLVCDGVDVAYSICAEGEENNCVLISFIAVYREYRGKGFGTAFIEKLANWYSDSNGIIVEVEKVEDAGDDEDRRTREKRIEFYKKSGFRLVTGISYSIWHVPMHLMVLPCKAPLEKINEDIGNIIYDIYFALLGKQYIHKMEFEKIL